jgi:DNA-binding transcriptional MocR family regulator
MIYEACRRGVLDRQLPVLRQHYARKRDVMEDALRREVGDAISWPKPKGGFFLWVTLPREIDAAHMIARAIEQGVIYVTGDAFYVDGSGQNTLRLSFSAPTHERIQTGVARLAATLRDERAARATTAGAAPRVSS